MKYAPHFRAEAQDGLVRRCEGTGDFFDTPEAADEAGKADGRPYVVANEVGAVHVEAPADVEPKSKRHR